MVRKTDTKLSKPPQPRQAAAQADEFISGAGDKARPEGGYPWEASDLRSDVFKVFNLRLSEPTKAKLQWLAERSPQSMHQIAVEAVEAEIERRIGQQTD